MNQHIIQHCGVAVDFSRVKSMQLNKVAASKYHISIELNARMEYILNPLTETFEKEVFNDIVHIVHTDYDMANAYLAEWVGIWQVFLSSVCK